ncbi:spermidine synthase [Candidatus Sulfurimonas marisnigri]|uniref:Spermidine synthase n=1 Tax=Candidatus Sulfurimonas marisnigri TaxID=2740405 RepID=A0A7S7M061_9BACT|nr:spermidine synthase [Candidatus Sulfurimonas marisnigri]QOY54616.1 spermidine synthase [Candidatus Sulfurimonas marisnigri]
MNEFTYPEMMVHVPLCTSKDPKNVLIISDNAELLSEELERHVEVGSKVISCKLEAISALEDKAYDVVISEMQADAAFISHIDRVLEDDGQFVTIHPTLDETEANKILMKTLGRYFKVIMPYNLGNCSTALLSSKEYHPTADINLHRSDMIDGLSYYNCDVHVASFAMGNYIRKEYLGIVKN